MNYSLQQLDIINSNDTKIVVSAGAGTGKTATILAMMNRLIRDGIDPDSILVLTFTNAAAFELSKRYESSYGIDGSGPTFKTFHSYCYTLIGSNPAVLHAIGYDRLPVIVSDQQYRQYFKDIRSRTGTKLSIKKLQSLQKLSQQEEFERSIFWKELRRFLRSHNLITFKLLIDSVTKLFIEDNECVSPIKESLNYIFVDEFQDTDRTQWDFVQSFSDTSLVVIGDLMQNIYSFRDASPDIMKSLIDDPAWATKYLTQNFRSTIPICLFANDFVENNRQLLEFSYHPLVSTTAGVDVCVRSVESDYNNNFSTSLPTDVLYSLANEIPDIVADLYQPTTAVLARTNHEVSQVSEYLTQFGIPVVHKDQHTFDLDIIRASADSTYLMNWIPTMLSPNGYLDYIRYTSSTIPTIDCVLDRYSRDESAGDAISLVKKIHAILDNRVDFHSCVQDILCQLSLGSAHEESLINSFVDSYYSDDSQQMLAISEACCSCIERYYDTSVYVGTIHSVKGREFDFVYVMKNFTVDNQDSLNLLYVAYTRAKKFLKVYDMK